MTAFVKFTANLQSLSNIYPHGSNLKTKIKKNLNEKEVQAFQLIEKPYNDIIKHTKKFSTKFDLWLKAYIKKVDSYIGLLKGHPINLVFSHQSDFVSSVFPEVLCNVFNQMIKRGKYEFLVEGQRDLIVEIKFSNRGEGFFPKYKRVDAAIVSSVYMQFNKKKIDNFLVPLVAVEVKTNLDKNMISGIEHSVERLKSTFPLCKYFVISEFSDFGFASQNYANSLIDEIFVLRKQKRADYRKSGKAKNISYSLMKEIVDCVKDALLKNSGKTDTLEKKMKIGRLIKSK